MKKLFSLMLVLISTTSFSQTVYFSTLDLCSPSLEQIQVDSISGLNPTDDVTLRTYWGPNFTLSDTTNQYSNLIFPIILGYPITMPFEFTFEAKINESIPFASYQYIIGETLNTTISDTIFVFCDNVYESEWLIDTLSSQYGCDSIVRQWQEVILYTPEICIVTDTNGYNSVIFEKNNPGTDLGYIIYRNSDSIGVIMPGDNSIFIDSIANSFTQSYAYSIVSNVLGCGASYESNEHRTIHLQENLGLSDQANLSWTDYEGFNISDLTYSVQRTRGGVTSELASIPTGNSPTYTDFDFQIGDTYTIVLATPYICSPSSGKRDAGLSSKSNRITPGSTGISYGELDLSSVYSYDNRIVGSIDNAKLTITNISGQIVTTDNLSGIFNIEVNTPGVYIVTIQTDSAIGSTKVIIL